MTVNEVQEMENMKDKDVENDKNFVVRLINIFCKKGTVYIKDLSKTMGKIGDKHKLNSGITWDRFKVISNHKFISSMYIWLFLVPFIANALTNLNDTFPITVFSYTFEFKSSLPFSWQAFFYSSLLFTIANGLRFAYCPKIIMNHDNYASFKESEMTFEHLLEYEAEFEQPDRVKARRLNRKLVIQNGSTVKGTPAGETSTAFWEIHKKANNIHKKIRNVIALLYFVGFILIAWVVLQGVVSVIRLGLNF
jgi:hypothetical protein